MDQILERLRLLKYQSGESDAASAADAHRLLDELIDIVEDLAIIVRRRGEEDQ